MKKIAIIVSLLFCMLYASKSIAQIAQHAGVFINTTKGYSTLLILNSDRSFIFGYVHGIHNSGEWGLKDKNNLTLKFNRQTVFISGRLDGLISTAKLINKNTIEYDDIKLRRYPKHPTIRKKEGFEAFEHIIKTYEREKINF